MAYQVRRVPLSFQWDLREPWPGLEVPHCLACEGAGVEDWRATLQSVLPAVIAAVEASRGQHFVRALTARKVDGELGHLASFLLAGRLAKLVLNDDRAGICRVCDGTGEHAPPGWEPKEPPVGEGWQLWEGAAPISNVFLSAEILAAWAERALGLADFHQWMGFALSGVAAPAWMSHRGEQVSGVQIIGDSEWALRQEPPDGDGA